MATEAQHNAEQPDGADRPPYVAPRTPAERQVAEVWSALLDVEQVGAHDDFFGLSGTSLLLLRLAARLEAATGGPVDLAKLFEATTVEAQALLVSEPRQEPEGPKLVRRPRPGADGR
ncbi:phosphopantetheine-binding protein [Streptomyces naphthomycinicus]|uniref:phosphopantetheine-binding protein n=1 Tax=Streptomyces naphthomycinicus TaxID=2872625 RepID=UPI001CED5EDA|nr:phosphopantetheine-binding protein [Streptomyces sp. TML10]